MLFLHINNCQFELNLENGIFLNYFSYFLSNVGDSIIELQP